MNRNLTPWIFIVAIILASLSSTLFTVKESERAIIARLGELVTVAKTDMVKVLGPGLHMKWPFIDRVHSFDARLNMTEIPSERIVTKEKEVLMVDLFVQWKIRDYALFYNTTHGALDGLGSKDRAEQLLRQNVKGVLHAEFGQRALQEVVSGERDELMLKLVRLLNENIKPYGMQVIDLRINRVDYPPEVNDKVFARMSSERKQAAVRFRATGESEAAKIRADADRMARVMIAESEKESERLRGEGDAKAVQVYADTYNKSPEFFEFYRSLEAYRKTFKDKQDVFVLKPDGDFFKYFKFNPRTASGSGGGNNASASSANSANNSSP